LDYLESIRSRIRLLGVDPERVINMNQTHDWFNMDPLTTIEAVGTRTVNIRRSKSASKRVTIGSSPCSPSKAHVLLVDVSGDSLGDFAYYIVQEIA
jgi:hypothetical protein